MSAAQIELVDFDTVPNLLLSGFSYRVTLHDTLAKILDEARQVVCPAITHLYFPDGRQVTDALLSHVQRNFCLFYITTPQPAITSVPPAKFLFADSGLPMFSRIASDTCLLYRVTFGEGSIGLRFDSNLRVIAVVAQAAAANVRPGDVIRAVGQTPCMGKHQEFVSLIYSTRRPFTIQFQRMSDAEQYIRSIPRTIVEKFQKLPETVARQKAHTSPSSVLCRTSSEAPDTNNNNTGGNNNSSNRNVLASSASMMSVKGSDKITVQQLLEHPKLQKCKAMWEKALGDIPRTSSLEAPLSSSRSRAISEPPRPSSLPHTESSPQLMSHHRHSILPTQQGIFSTPPPLVSSATIASLSSATTLSQMGHRSLSSSSRQAELIDDDECDPRDMILDGVGSLPSVITHALKQCSDTNTHMTQAMVLEKLWQHRANMKKVLSQLTSSSNDSGDQAAVNVSTDAPPVDVTDDESTLIFDEQNKEIKAGTLKSLVERLTSEDTSDTSFKFDFLLTYRSFTTGRILLDHLIDRLVTASFDVLDDSKFAPVQLRVVNVIKYWLETYYHDFEEDELLLTCLLAYIQIHLESRESLTPLCQLLTRALQRKIEGKEKTYVVTELGEKPKPLLTHRKKNLGINLRQREASDILDFEPLEIARQLCLVSSRVFRDIKPKELVNLNWSKKDGSKRAPNVFTMIQRVNLLCRWAQFQILSVEDSKARGDLISTFLKIAYECTKLQNFNDANAILGCVKSAAIYRLAKMKDLSGKEAAMLRELEELFYGGTNGSNMRAKLATLEPPCVPFLGTFLTDLTFIEEGNKDQYKNNAQLINFYKRRKIARVIQQIQQLQQGQYVLTEVDRIQTVLLGLAIDINDDELYNMSLKVEPRAKS